ncbi:MAG: YkgJ family cysteine cluster protein [Gallionella sp.]|jgi:Fe-S-cluster containining protein
MTIYLKSSNDPVTCATCRACCCRLEVMLMGDDEPPAELTEQDEWGGWVMSRLDDGWCAALNRSNMLCTIYAQRPMICRDYQAGDDDCMNQRKLINNQ